jgi:serine/threonine protein kinase
MTEEDKSLQDEGQELPEWSEEPQEDGVESMDLGISIPGYDLVQEINRGGQAIIFKAKQRSTGRRVAIKILLEGPLGSQVDRSRMEREVRILASLDHPNIVSAIDRGETPEGWPYFVLEYVDGQILAEYMDELRAKYPPLGVPRDLTPLLKLFARICEAVHAAHLRGVVHRDLKPDNIVVDPYGEPHILDFGVARAPLEWVTEKDQLNPDTMMGEFLGSLQWASPEQVEGESSKIDIRSDVYSLGMMFYEMLTGEFPYDVFGGIREVLDNIVNAVPEPPGELLDRRIEEEEESGNAGKISNPVDSVLDSMVLKALEKDPKERYQSAGELARDIHDYLDGRVVRVAPPKRRKPNRLVPLVVLLTVVVVAGIGYLLLPKPVSSHLPKVQDAAEQVIVVVQEDVFGYRIEGNDVVFEFDPRDYSKARMADGSLGTLSEVAQVERVVVAGPFNLWKKDNEAWVMQKVGRQRFVLRKPLELFAEKAEWPFKFVVNNAVWVGAPEDAENKAIVAEDTATYNLILKNPRNTTDKSAEELRQYRAEIDLVWPGQGKHLALDDAGRYHFTFTHFPEGTMIRTLEPLAQIPLITLNLGDVRVANLAALKQMTNLQTLLCNDAMYWKLVSGIIPSLEQKDCAQAVSEAAAVFEGYEQNPACMTFRAFMQRAVDNYCALGEAAQAPAGALEFGGHQYIAVLIPMTWPEARRFAAGHGGALVSVRSEEQQQWLTQQFGLAGLGRMFWLGGTDAAVEGNWTWVNGERWNYENWTPPEPNNQHDSEHALAMRSDGWWIDADGNALKLPFIIEW